MQVHTVEEGETLDRIAQRYGFPTGASLYQHPDNAELRRRRPDPRFIAPGDVVVIPSRPSRAVSCETGYRYTFVARTAEPEVQIRVALYGDVALKRYIAVDAGLKYQGLASGEADVAVAFGTDGEIAALDLVLLEDDKGLFPPYQVAPVVRREALERHPAIREALDRLAPLLTDDVMRGLNNEVTLERREPADVARAFLVREGLVT